MKKRVVIVVIAIVLTLSLTCISYAESYQYIENNGVKLFVPGNMEVAGFINIRGETSKAKIKLLVIKDDDKAWYDVKLDQGKFSEEIWLNHGVGKYTIYIMVHVYDRKYSHGPKLEVDNINKINSNLNPEKYIESRNPTIVNKAVQITKGSEGEVDKARAIYQWVRDNIKYDYDKYKKHQAGNYDNSYGALATLASGKGVCFDYAAITAALSRAAGLQCRIVTGKGKLSGESGYHAWNEVYITESGKWIKLDTTFASISKKDFFDNSEFDESHIAQ